MEVLGMASHAESSCFKAFERTAYCFAKRRLVDRFHAGLLTELDVELVHGGARHAHTFTRFKVLHKPTNLIHLAKLYFDNYTREY